jgi:hypothetical protein
MFPSLPISGQLFVIVIGRNGSVNYNDAIMMDPLVKIIANHFVQEQCANASPNLEPTRGHDSIGTTTELPE